MTVKLTLWQRMNLEGIIRAQRVAESPDFLTMYDVWKKITVPDSERKEYAQNPCVTCGLARMFDMDRVNLAPARDVDIEKAEARKLIELLAGWKQFNVDDGEWLFPLKVILKEAAGEASPAKAATAPHGGSSDQR